MVSNSARQMSSPLLIEKLDTWTINDLRNPRNGITILLDSNNHQIPNTTMDGIKSELGEKRVPSNTLLSTHEYGIVMAKTGHESPFGASGGEGAQVSEPELDAFVIAVTELHEAGERG